MATYLVTYKVYGGSHEGYHTATVLACDPIEHEEGLISAAGTAVVDDDDEPQRRFDAPIVQFRWWFQETSWVEVRAQACPETVGAVIEDLPKLD